jgi:hypothetical protein
MMSPHPRFLLSICRVRHILFAMNPTDKPLVWLSGEVKSPPLSTEARIEAGYLLRCLQAGQNLAMPHSQAHAEHRDTVSRIEDSRRGFDLAPDLQRGR